MYHGVPLHRGQDSVARGGTHLPRSTQSGSLHLAFTLPGPPFSSHIPPPAADSARLPVLLRPSMNTLQRCTSVLSSRLPVDGRQLVPAGATVWPRAAIPSRAVLGTPRAWSWGHCTPPPPSGQQVRQPTTSADCPGLFSSRCLGQSCLSFPPVHSPTIALLASCSLRVVPDPSGDRERPGRGRQGGSQQQPED